MRAAVVTLAELQALDPQQSLTPLGHHLATLPCDVRIGKMLLFACMLRCLHPVLVIAAVELSYTPPRPYTFLYFFTQLLVRVLYCIRICLLCVTVSLRCTFVLG